MRNWIRGVVAAVILVGGAVAWAGGFGPAITLP